MKRVQAIALPVAFAQACSLILPGSAFAFELPKTLKPIFDFTIHVVVGSLGFIIVFLAAVSISAVVKAFDGIVPHWVAVTSEYAEMALFGTDMVLFALFMLSEAIRLVRGLWREWAS